jgi:tripartite-type tricarboxylate transporter receptor subunit TctC
VNLDYLNAEQTRAFVEKEVADYTEMATAIGIRR